MRPFLVLCGLTIIPAYWVIAIMAYAAIRLVMPALPITIVLFILSYNEYVSKEI